MSYDDPFSLATIIADDFILVPGTYNINCVAKGSGVLRLFNETSSTTVISGTNTSGEAFLRGRFTISSPDQRLEIQHWLTKNNDEKSIDIGVDEVYMVAEICYEY